MEISIFSSTKFQYPQVMGRRRQISQDAIPTTISLTLNQQIAFQEFQVACQKRGEAKPTLTAAMLAGFRLLLRQDGRSEADLERIFPKEAQRKATVHVISKRRKR